MIRFKLKNYGSESEDEDKIKTFGQIVDLDETKYDAIEV